MSDKERSDNTCRECGEYLLDWDKKQPLCSDCEIEGIEEEIEKARKDERTRVLEEIENKGHVVIENDGFKWFRMTLTNWEKLKEVDE